MRAILRVLGYILATAAAVILARDLVTMVELREFQLAEFGQVWFELHRDSLQVAQPAVQRYLHPVIWDPIILTVLLWPAGLVIGVPGLALIALSKR